MTVFIQAKGRFVMAENQPKLTGKVPRQKVHHLLDAQEKMLVQLKILATKPKYNLKLGVHLLGKQDLVKEGKADSPINDLQTETQMQLDNITYLKKIINGTVSASYHGANAANVISANHSKVLNQFHRIRDTESSSPTAQQLELINPRTTTQFFFHAAELKQAPDKYKVYRTLLEGIQSGKYYSVPY